MTSIHRHYAMATILLLAAVSRVKGNSPRIIVEPLRAVRFAPILLQLSWKNTGPQPSTLWMPNEIDQDRMKVAVMDPTGRNVTFYPSSRGGTQLIGAVVAPNASIESAYNLLEYFPMFGAGVYRITVHLEVPSPVQVMLLPSLKNIEILNATPPTRVEFVVEVQEAKMSGDRDAAALLDEAVAAASSEAPLTYEAVWHSAVDRVVPVVGPALKDVAAYYAARVHSRKSRTPGQARKLETGARLITTEYWQRRALLEVAVAYRYADDVASARRVLNELVAEIADPLSLLAKKHLAAVDARAREKLREQR